MAKTCITQLIARLTYLVVASKTVDTGLDKDKTELGIAVLPESVQVLAH